MHGVDESIENAHAEKTDLVFYVRHLCRQSVPCGEVLLRLQREIFLTKLICEATLKFSELRVFTLLSLSWWPYAPFTPAKRI